jgi:hypothetical protein
VGVTMLTQLHHNPAAAYLVRGGSSSTRPCKWIEHPITFLRRQLKYRLN